MKKARYVLMLLAVCMIFSPRPSITAEPSFRTTEYPQMKEALMKGWNTWDTRSVLTHVLMPEGLAIQLQIQDNKTGKTLKTALIGRRGKKEEHVSPGLRSYDGAYTDLTLQWQGITIRVQSAATGENLVILVEPEPGSGPGKLIIRPEMFYGRVGSISRNLDIIEARLPFRTAGVFVDSGSTPIVNGVLSPHLTVELDGPVWISIGVELTREEVEETISTAREDLLESKDKYGDLIDLHNAQQTVLAWNVIYEPTQDRVITPVSRIWNMAWGGYVLFDWDTYFAAYMLSMDSRELAYANAIEVTRGITEDGFIPNYTHPGIWSRKEVRKSRDRSQPPVGSMVVREIYRKYREKWFLEETFDDLLSWNRWWDSNRVTQGYLCWGSNPYWKARIKEDTFVNEGWEKDFSSQRKSKDSSIEVASSAISNFELEPSDFGVFYPHIIYLTDRFFAANKHQGAAWESGLDNSPMYDDVPFNRKTHMMELADVGLLSMYVMDCEALADIADELGRTEESAELRARAEKYRDSLRGLWEDEFGLYLNRRTDTGELSYRISPTNFYPLLAKAPSPEQAGRMMNEHFYNPEEFWGEYIMPSIARNDPAFADNVYWRGRIWAPMNFLVYMGMRNYDLPKARQDLVEKSKDLLLNSWLSEGHVYENYNGTTGVGDDVANSDKFYHWGALLGFISFIEEGFVSRPEESL